MSPANPTVDWFFSKPSEWQKEYAALRAIALKCDLTEELKWGQPCYVSDKKNVVLIHGFKEYCALLFMRGAILKDPKGILVQQTENVQSARQIRFTRVDEINELAETIEAYIREAMVVTEIGLEVKMKETSEFPMPDELRIRLENNPDFKAAFEALTPGRQRGYLLHFAAPKQSQTRESRIDKCTPLIFAGKGLMDDMKDRRDKK